MKRYNIPLLELLAALGLFIGIAVIGYNLIAGARTPRSIRLDVVTTEEARRKGLSGLARYDDMMLFVFDHPAIQCMWAKDMKFPVRVQFLSDIGELSEVEVLQPGSTTPYCSAQVVRYALETEAK